MARVPSWPSSGSTSSRGEGVNQPHVTVDSFFRPLTLTPEAHDCALPLLQLWTPRTRPPTKSAVGMWDTVLMEQSSPEIDPT